MRGGLAVLLALLAAGLGAQDLGKAPWPGMTAWDAAWCRDLVARATLIELEQDDGQFQVLKVTDVRGWRKPNGFYGLAVNGQHVDEARVWLGYGGRRVNLRVLFTYGSDPVRDNPRFSRD